MFWPNKSFKVSEFLFFSFLTDKSIFGFLTLKSILGLLTLTSTLGPLNLISLFISGVFMSKLGILSSSIFISKFCLLISVFKFKFGLILGISISGFFIDISAEGRLIFIFPLIIPVEL